MVLISSVSLYVFVFLNLKEWRWSNKQWNFKSGILPPNSSVMSVKSQPLWSSVISPIKRRHCNRRFVSSLLPVTKPCSSLSYSQNGVQREQTPWLDGMVCPTLESFFFFSCFLGLHLRHMEVSRLGDESEPQPPAFATAIPYLSCVCDLHHSTQQLRILNPLREARDPTCNLMVSSWIHFCCATMGTPQLWHL